VQRYGVEHAEQRPFAPLKGSRRSQPTPKFPLAFFVDSDSQFKPGCTSCLRQDVRDVVFHGLVGEAKFPRDPHVPHAIKKKVENVALGVAEKCFSAGHEP